MRTVNPCVSIQLISLASREDEIKNANQRYPPVSIQLISLASRESNLSCSYSPHYPSVSIQLISLASREVYGLRSCDSCLMWFPFN